MKDVLRFSHTLMIEMPDIEAKVEGSKARRAAEAAVKDGLVRGIGYIQIDLKVALDKSMNMPQWTWPRGGNRDIIDTGTLRNSLKMAYKVSGTSATIKGSYNTPYAAFVHYGGVMKPYGNQYANDVIIPARPWVRGVLTGTYGQSKIDIKTPMAEAMREAWQA